MGEQQTKLKGQPFSMVELMVVFAVLAILASMLMPSLRKTMDYGIQTHCKNNVKSIALATGVYQHDYAYYFPYGIPMTPGTFSYNEFTIGKPNQELLVDYLADPKTNFICPADETPENYWYWRYRDHPKYDQVASGSSYMYSEHALLGVNYWLKDSHSIHNMRQPSTFGYMADGRAFPNGWRWRNVDPNTPGLRIDWTHSDMVNFMFGDLHIEAVYQIDAPEVRSDPR